ncbi:unnamed protein product, partial [Iphiclides podalirius]
MYLGAAISQGRSVLIQYTRATSSNLEKDFEGLIIDWAAAVVEACCPRSANSGATVPAYSVSRLHTCGALAPSRSCGGCCQSGPGGSGVPLGRRVEAGRGEPNAGAGPTVRPRESLRGAFAAATRRIRRLTPHSRKRPRATRESEEVRTRLDRTRTGPETIERTGSNSTRARTLARASDRNRATEKFEAARDV